MFDDSTKSSKRVLDPIDRVSEVLFGLIMVLAFTGSLSVAESGRDDVRVDSRGDVVWVQQWICTCSASGALLQHDWWCA